MAKIELESVCVEFPIYNVSARSLKKDFLRLTTGGKVVGSTHHVTINALSDLNLILEDGDHVGLIGHNGAGKSTLLKLLATIYEPTRGNISIQGKISPMLNLMQGIETELSGYENITLRGTVLGLKRKEIDAKIVDIAAFTELGDYLAMPVRTYSSGMMVRLAFAISTCITPDILLIDEVFGEGDFKFMQKAQEKMHSLVRNSQIVVMATHSDKIIEEFCTKGLVLDEGRIKYFGPLKTAFEVYHAK